MDVVHCAEMPWGESLVAQRGDTAGMAHKRLFEGEEGNPDNYMLVMAREPKSYFSPRHRHPWDQIRFCLEGKIPIARGLYIEGGEICYFPESARYGPQEGGEDRIVLLLQFGGASGQGFIGPDRLNQARLELAKKGTFESGVYTVATDQGRTNRDAYEAIWAHEKGEAPAYVSPAYKTPIVMRPEALAWEKAEEEGVFVKRAGIFPHRRLAITARRIEAGSHHPYSSEPALRFLFVTSGQGQIGGVELRRWSAVRLQPREKAIVVAAGGGLELMELEIGLVAPETRYARAPVGAI
jgi:hypothetical protein